MSNAMRQFPNILIVENLIVYFKKKIKLVGH